MAQVNRLSMTILGPALVFSALASKEFDLAANAWLMAGKRRRRARVRAPRVAGGATDARRLPHARADRDVQQLRQHGAAACGARVRAGRVLGDGRAVHDLEPAAVHRRHLAHRPSREVRPLPAQSDGVGDGGRLRFRHHASADARMGLFRHQDGRRRADPDDAALARRAPVRSALGRLAPRRGRRHRVPGDGTRDGARCWRRCSGSRIRNAACSSCSARCRRRCSTSWSPSSSSRSPRRWPPSC